MNSSNPIPQPETRQLAGFTITVPPDPGQRDAFVSGLYQGLNISSSIINDSNTDQFEESEHLNTLAQEVLKWPSSTAVPPNPETPASSTS